MNSSGLICESMIEDSLYVGESHPDLIGLPVSSRFVNLR